MGIPTRGTWLVVLAASVLAGPAFAVDADLSDLSLEELARVEITSVSRRAEPLGEAAASVYLIDADDIRRSGAASLPEVLRLAPNLQVQRVNAGDYAITARGFNSYETSNKLLVLIDGRSVYSTLHSGVFWDAQTMMLEDIERIEVVSGPGGTLFGANAVNGVINIITRSAADTKGTLGSIGIGSEDKTLALRHGGALGENAAWRAYVSAFDRDDSLRENGDDATDATSGVRAGARTDWASGAQTLTVQGEIFTNRMRTNEDFTGARTRANGGHLLGRWTHAFERAGQLEVQAYYNRNQVASPASLERDVTYDIHVQQTFAWHGRHQLVIGGGYRSVDSELLGAPGLAFLDPPDLTVSLADVFAQDQVALTDALTLTVGVKFEDNSFTGQEFLPNVRLAWRSPDGSLYWGAVSRASRTPSRIERGLTLPGIVAASDFQSESLVAYELGYRANPTPNTAVSVSAFYNEYDDIRTVDITPVTLLPLVFDNDVEGHTSGVEAWGSWDVNPRWRLSAGVSTLEKDFEVKAGQIDISAMAATGDDPAYQVQLRSRLDVTDRIELDLRLRGVDELDTSGTDDYVQADARLGWRLKDDVELAVTGQNLIGDQHLETDDLARHRAFGRAVYANLRWSF